jgi:soluble lytic murein transglycosylase
LVLLLACAAQGATGPAADPVLAAHEAYSSRDLSALEKLATGNPTHPLADYIRFWWIEARLGTALRLVAPGEVRQFLAHSDGPLSESLRADWLKALAQQQAWTELLADGAAYAGTDPEVVCGLATAHQLAGDPEVLDPLRAAWLSARSSPSSCEPVFARLLAGGQLSQDDILARIQLALQVENLSLARALAALLTGESELPDAALVQVGADPAAWLQSEQMRGRSRSARLLELHALMLVARNDPARARALWDRLTAGLPPSEGAQGWARIGVQAAQRLDPAALGDFRRIHDATPRDAELEWWVRSALRVGAWPDVLRATEAMSEATASQPAWRFWRARALKAAGRRDEAASLLGELARDNDFYGQLAQDELGQHPMLAGAARAEVDEVSALRLRPGIQRALQLLRLGLRPEAVREWNFALKSASERQLLAAAELARQAEWYDRMIACAERAGSQSDISLRYPTPYRDRLRLKARQRALDEAWVYGLVRQESRFLADARSRVGATGLMQLMPATSRWVARKIGMQDFKAARSEEVDVNLALGSYYLRHVLDNLGSPVLATAAYNAGPNRVRRWLELRPLEGAVFCETIPVAETREYVKKVMANVSLYALRLGQPARTFGSRLGTIQGLGGVPAPDPSEQNPGFDAPMGPAPTIRVALPAAATKLAVTPPAAAVASAVQPAPQVQAVSPVLPAPQTQPVSPVLPATPIPLASPVLPTASVPDIDPVTAPEANSTPGAPALVPESLPTDP